MACGGGWMLGYLKAAIGCPSVTFRSSCQATRRPMLAFVGSANICFRAGPEVGENSSPGSVHSDGCVRDLEPGLELA